MDGTCNHNRKVEWDDGSKGGPARVSHSCSWNEESSSWSCPWDHEKGKTAKKSGADDDDFGKLLMETIAKEIEKSTSDLESASHSKMENNLDLNLGMSKAAFPKMSMNMDILNGAGMD